tara:strand:- start:1018 stop:1182 length:165 start_codon:yes stop_codon:yes gene_type:complete
MKEGARAAQVKILAFLSIINVPSLFTKTVLDEGIKEGGLTKPFSCSNLFNVVRY